MEDLAVDSDFVAGRLRRQSPPGPANVLQPYCNRAGTGAYTVDELSPRLSQNTCKIAKFADELVQARTHHSRLLISRFQVRVLGGSLPFFLQTARKRQRPRGVLGVSVQL